jgi:hypothetical protein
VCPLCKRIYDSDVIKVCPLAHCPNCGSTDIKHVYDLDYALKMSGYIGLIFAICFFVEEVSILASIAFSILPPLPEIDWLWLIVFPYNLPPLTALCGILVMFITLAILRGKQHCNTCGVRFYFPIRNVPLGSEETISDMIRSEIEKIRNFMEELGS